MWMNAINPIKSLASVFIQKRWFSQYFFQAQKTESVICCEFVYEVSSYLVEEHEQKRFDNTQVFLYHITG